MEALKEIKELILKAHNAYGVYNEQVEARMQLVSMLYRTIYDLETYWRGRSGVHNISFRPKALKYIEIIDFPSLGWEFSINEETKELCCINHLSALDSRSTKIMIPLAYYEDRYKYLDSVKMDMLEFARKELKKQMASNERKLKVIEEQMKEDRQSMYNLNEMLNNRGKLSDELF